MSSQVRISRKQALAYRIRAQQLDRPRGLSLARLAVLDLGVQDAGGQSRLAIDARLSNVTEVPDDPTAGGRLSLVWSVRAAPHLHRPADLAAVRRATWPLSDLDAMSRLGDASKRLTGAGLTGLDAWTEPVQTLRSLLPAAMPKGDASRALSDALPEHYSRACRTCQAKHVSDLTLRPAAFFAGATLDWDTSPPVLRKQKGRRPAVPEADIRPMIEAYLHLLGPARPADVAGYLGARAADFREVWPDELAEVELDGRAAFALADDVSTMRKARMRQHVRLLGPYDPWLQARDRDVIVPDKAVHKKLWPVIGRPGALLVDGEIVGTWRTKASGKKLALSVDTLAPLPPDTRRKVEQEANRIGTLRGVEATRVTMS